MQTTFLYYYFRWSFHLSTERM